MASPTLDKRHTIHESGWHGADGAWGDGVQHEVIDSIPQLAATLEAKNGIPGLEIVQPSTDPAFAERASSLLQRDGFVCIADVVPEELRAALQLKCEESMEQIVALDQYQGAKGAWRYMFGGTCSAEYTFNRVPVQRNTFSAVHVRRYMFGGIPVQPGPVQCSEMQSTSVLSSSVQSSQSSPANSVKSSQLNSTQPI